jgi:hypothetical protein
MEPAADSTKAAKSESICPFYFQALRHVSSVCPDLQLLSFLVYRDEQSLDASKKFVQYFI